VSVRDKTEYITADQYRALKVRLPGRKEQPETTIRRNITKFLRLHGCKVVRIVQSALSEKGIPDLVAIRGGQTVWIEVKTPKGQLSEHQKRWLQDLEDHGGWWIVARSVEDVEHLAEPVAPRAKVWALIERGRVLCASAVCDERCPNRAQCVETELILPPGRR